MVSESKFKTMRHIETVRNYLDAMVRLLISKSELHDQSKLQTPEVEIFEEYTPKLRGTTYGSDEYRGYMKEMKPAIEHHNENNSHHPEHHKDGIMGMDLLDLIEMLCDWKAATMRHGDGDIFKSLEINQERFGYSADVKQLFKNTIHTIEMMTVEHHAHES